MENSVSYEVGDQVAIVIDGKIFRTGIIYEFRGDNIVIETPTSTLLCNVLYIEHYPKEENNES